jgi:hypothetical protein
MAAQNQAVARPLIVAVCNRVDTVPPPIEKSGGGSPQFCVRNIWKSGGGTGTGTFSTDFGLSVQEVRRNPSDPMR